MDMTSSVSASPNLLNQTVKSIQEINDWTWSELLVALKQYQDLLQSMNSCSVLDKLMDCLVGRMSSESSPCQSSSSLDTSGTWLSFDTRSTESLKTRLTWWFEDLLLLNTNSLERVITSMVSRKFGHAIIGKFLLYYQKSKLSNTASDEKCKVVETIINMLYILDWNSVSCKSLFGILRMALTLNISKCSRNKLKTMIGSQLDQANLDDLLIPSPHGLNCLYDVNLVIRLLKAFTDGRNRPVFATPMKKVARLLDMYMAEVAPDPHLKPFKFIALAVALPECARDSYDNVYHSVDMYIQVHAGLSEDEKMKICCSINYEKLSAETCLHLSQNKNFPSSSAFQALISQQVKLKNLLKTNSTCSDGSPCAVQETGNKNESSLQIIHYAGSIDNLTHNANIRTRLQGMQLTAMELEKLCKKMQMQLSKIMKAKISSHRSLPRLCS